MAAGPLALRQRDGSRIGPHGAGGSGPGRFGTALMGRAGAGSGLVDAPVHFELTVLGSAKIVADPSTPVGNALYRPIEAGPARARIGGPRDAVEWLRSHGLMPSECDNDARGLVHRQARQFGQVQDPGVCLGHGLQVGY
jgi:hypothetical protein